MQNEEKEINFEPKEHIVEKIKIGKILEVNAAANLTNKDFEKDYESRLKTLQTVYTNLDVLKDYFRQMSKRAQSSLDPMSGLAVAMLVNLDKTDNIVKIAVKATHDLYDKTLFKDPVQNDNNI